MKMMTTGCFRPALALLILTNALGSMAPRAAADEHWVTTWACGAQLTEPQNRPPAPGLTTNTLRQVIHATIGGSRLRARFSNEYGTNAVTIQSVHVANSAGGSAIDPSTDKPLMFHGAASVTLQPGEVTLSDPFDFNLGALSSLTVSIHFGETSWAITGHPGSRATSYIVPGDAVTATNMTGAASTQHWYILTGLDVDAPSSSAAVVTLGDSITDGRGSEPDHNNRWPDNFARRLNTNAPTANVAVVNMGVGGGAVVRGGLGPTALKRFDRDVLQTSGVRWAIVFEGVNDIGGSRGGMVATNLINAYQEFIDKAHAKGLRIYGATITPFGTSFYFSPAHETARETVNDWIRTSGKFDAVIDFDAAVRDPANSTNLLSNYDSGDHLHLSVAGYQRMGEAIDLGLFKP